MAIHGIFKLASSLPLALDGYRFLGGGPTEDKYVLFSDFYSLNDDEAKNVFTIAAQTSSDTYVRAYAEDNTVKFELACTNDFKRSSSYSEASAFIQAELPKGAACKLALQSTKKVHLEKKVFLQEKVRITIMVASAEYAKEFYRQYHAQALSACKTNQWPLALSKNMDMVANHDEQSYYNYPLIRFPVGQSTSGNSYATTMNTYYFRFNETQRFYFEVGSNFIESHAVLVLQPTQKSFGAYELYGKQLGNINVIDTDVAPGDYALKILGYQSSQSPCAAYSFRGLLNMHSAMAQHLPGSAKLFRGSTMCEIRNSEEAPTQIFASELKTRKGNEAVIDPEGNFFHFYNDLLIVKAHAEVLEPWSHEILLEVPDTSFL